MGTWPQWKHAQKAVLRDQHRLYQEMYVSHNLFFRWAMWVSRTDEKYNPVKIIYRKATPHLKQFGKIIVHAIRYIAPRINYLEWYDRTHITRWDRRTMQRLNLTEEEMFARKAEYYKAVRLARQFWVPPINLVRDIISAIKTIVNNIRNSTRR